MRDDYMRFLDRRRQDPNILSTLSLQITEQEERRLIYVGNDLLTCVDYSPERLSFEIEGVSPICVTEVKTVDAMRQEIQNRRVRRVRT